jgi:hypothetical protein
MIAPKLHFIFGLWDTGPIPRRFADNIQAWQRALPQLSVKVWDRSDCRQLLKKYQELNWIFQLRPVQQADLLRLLVTYDEGGWYNDLDTCPAPCVATTWQSCSIKDLAVIIERIGDANSTRMSRDFRYRKGVAEDPVRIANFSFAAGAQNAFFWKCIGLAEQRCKAYPSGSDDYYPLFTTGPDVITTAYHISKLDSSSLLPAGDWCMHAETGTWRNNRA